MRKTKIIIVVQVLLLFLTGCASDLIKSPSFNADFETLDLSQDGIVTTEEFTKHFQKIKGSFPPGADADKDGKIYPDEWHEFRAMKGYIEP